MPASSNLHLARTAAESRIEYVPEFGRAVRIAEYDRPMSGDDEETAQTIAYMDELAAADSNDPAIADAVSEALEFAGLDTYSNPLEQAKAVYWWLKRTIRYVPTPGTSPLVDQTLITPCAVLAMPEPIGDCPQFSMLAAAMFRVLCIPCRFVTIKAETKAPDQWSHVYNTVEVAPGVFMPFDSSNGPAPGSEYARPFARRVWPNLTPGRCRTKEGGATSMMRNIYGRVPGMRNATTRRALGATVCDESGCYDDGSGATPPPTDLCTDPSCMMTGPNPTQAQLNQPLAPLPTTAPSSSSPSWVNALLSDATQLGTQVLRTSTQKAPYFITSPTGQSVLYNPNTGAVGNSTGIANLGTISPTILLGGLGLLALFAFAGKK